MPYLKIGKPLISETSDIKQGAIIGKPYRPLTGGYQQEESSPTTIRDNVYVGYYSIVGSGTELSEGVIIDDYCSIESDVRIGRDTLIIYRAQICNDVNIGNKCVIGGFIGENSVVGDECRIFGEIIHSQRDPSKGWDLETSTEESVVINSNVFVGFGAKLIGGIKIGKESYIAAGAIVTRDVPERSVVYGVNNIVNGNSWKGPLKDSPIFSGMEY